MVAYCRAAPHSAGLTGEPPPRQTEENYFARSAEDAPATDSGADGKAGRRLCHETIYRHVYGPKGRTEQLYLCLPRARRRRAARHGRKPRSHRIPMERGIACRPAEAATRDSFGHWEGDLLIFARDLGPANVTTLLERRSRFLVLLANPNRRPQGSPKGILQRRN